MATNGLAVMSAIISTMRLMIRRNLSNSVRYPTVMLQLGVIKKSERGRASLVIPTRIHTLKKRTNRSIIMQEYRRSELA